MNLLKRKHNANLPATLTRLCTPDDILRLYHLLLGREPESEAVMKQHAGRPLHSAMSGFLRSEEFTALADSVIRSKRLPHFWRVNPNHLAPARSWIAQATGTLKRSAEANWWGLLQQLFEMASVRAELLQLGRQAYLSLIAEMAVSTAANSADCADLLAVKKDWFYRYHQQAAIARASGAYATLESYFLDSGLRAGMQLLPAFSEALADLYKSLRTRAGLKLDDVLAETIKAAQRGDVSHWLFAAPYYRSVLQWREFDKADTCSDSFDQGLYLHFISYGDGRRHSPHPLFSHEAYERLNGGTRNRGAFQDYLLEGCFTEMRTSALFDPDYYLASNPAARAALLSGTHVSALHHFLKVGIGLDAPFSPDFDLNFYRDRYPDVASAVAAGAMPSLTFHFVFNGLLEGREPNPYFHPEYYRQRHPHVTTEMRDLGIRSELEHFLLLGKARGYKPNPPTINAVPALTTAKAIFQRRSRRSYSNVLREGLDFQPFTSTHPGITVIVPVFNEVEFTARFLECSYFGAAFFRQITGLGCEVVVVDNGSTDGTDQLLARCPGVTVVSFDKAIGFPRAVNAGVARSKAEVIVVANNDIEFQPGNLVRIREQLERDPKLGLLGGLTILPNETLQEAGSYLDATGGVVGLGRGENPWDAYFQGLHRADYCTGTFISFRRSDFDAVGGMDEAFSPGYYEETDFAFRLRERLGKFAAVDSQIQVTHFEHASFSKGRPPMTAYALIKKNQQRFVSKHREELRRKPAMAELATEQGARPASLGRTRILVIEDLMPDTRLGSGFVRSSQLLDGLSRHRVPFDLMVLNASPVVDDYADTRVTVFRAWLPGESLDAVLAYHGAKYSHVMVCRLHNLARYSYLFAALRSKHATKIICDTEALSVLRVLESRRIAGQKVTREEHAVAVRSELEAPVPVSHWIAVSPYEQRQIEEAGFGPVSMICHHFPPRKGGHDAPWERRSRVLSVGAIHEPGSPNHDGLFWFMDQIYPKCADALAGLKLTLVGFWAPSIVESFRKRYSHIPIEILGTVSDEELNALYQETRIALAPTRFAAGVPSKVLEPMAIGVPVVMTDLLELQITSHQEGGVTGMAVGLRNDCGESFAHWVRVLATDKAAWERVRNLQLKYAEPLAGTEAFEAGIGHLLRTTGIDKTLR